MNELEQYILAAAAKRGIDPQVALRVARSEGGLDDPFQQSNVIKNGQREPSFGPFQLFMGGGMGNEAMAAGIDPRKDWRGGVDFALDGAAKTGWGPWYGAKAAGIGPREGIRGMTLNTPPQIVNGPGGSTISMAPPLAPPTVVADKPIGGIQTAKNTLDTFKDEGFLAGMKALGGADKGGDGFAALSKAFGGGEGRDPQAEAHATPIQSLLPAMEAGDMGRIQTGQALMAQLLAKRKTPGFTMNGIR